MALAHFSECSLCRVSFKTASLARHTRLPATAFLIPENSQHHSKSHCSAIPHVGRVCTPPIVPSCLASPPRNCSPPLITVDLPLTLLSRAGIDTLCAIQQFTMLYSSVIVAVSAFAGLAVAQNNTVIPCCTVTTSTVPEDMRQSWCDAQENTCVDLCGGQGDIASNGNTCDAVSFLSHLYAFPQQLTNVDYSLLSTTPASAPTVPPSPTMS